MNGNYGVWLWRNLKEYEAGDGSKMISGMMHALEINLLKRLFQIYSALLGLRMFSGR